MTTNEKNTIKVNFKVTPTQYNSLLEAANNTNISISEYIRETLFKGTSAHFDLQKTHLVNIIKLSKISKETKSILVKEILRNDTSYIKTNR